VELREDEQEITEKENVMEFVYSEVFVSEEKLASLKKIMDETIGESKYYRFKAWLHFANLERWQSQRWHHGYLSSQEGDICTCGLVMDEVSLAELNEDAALGSSMYATLRALGVEPIHLIAGHRNLPTLSGLAVAFTYDYQHHEELNAYLWDALCQGCGETVLQQRNDLTDAFVEQHNAKCGGK
jgi:hypothetical protein